MTRVLLVPLALLGATLAGCVAPGETVDPNVLPGDALGDAAAAVHAASGAAVPAALAGALAAEPALFRIGHDAVEPTLGLTSDGTVFYAAGTFENPAVADALPRTVVLRSPDGGATWEDVSPPSPSTFDPYVYVDPATDRVFSLDLEALLCSILSWSDDGGDTWTTHPAGCGLPPGVHDHQTMAAGPPRRLATVGYPNVVYYCVNRVADSACAASATGGLTWGPLVTVWPGVEDGKLCGGLHGHVTTGPDGTVLLGKGHCGVPEIARSTDDGLTWTRTVVSATTGIVGHEISVAADEAGNVHAFWVGTDGKAYLASSTDGGASFGEARDVTMPGVTAAHLPSLAAGAAGKVAFVYAGTTHPGGYDENEQTEDWAEATWHGYLGVVVDALAADPVVSTVMVNDPADPLVKGRCGPGRCPGMYDFIDVVVAADGKPYAAFVDACVDACAGPDGKPEDSRAFDGLMATLARGPDLRADGAARATAEFSRFALP